MASKKVGTLIKEARTEAGLTQEQLARRISGLSANDISLAERHQKNLTQDQLKQIAKITNVPIPRNLTGLKELPELHTGVIGKEEMLSFVLEA